MIDWPTILDIIVATLADLFFLIFSIWSYRHVVYRESKIGIIVVCISVFAVQVAVLLT